MSQYNLKLTNGDYDVGRGKLGSVLFNSPSGDINLSTLGTFYNKYVLNPSLNINCTLPTIGTLFTNVTNGNEIYIINVSNFNITLVGVSFIMRPNSIIHLISKTVGVWQILSKYDNISTISANNAAPSVLATDVVGDIYIDKSSGLIYMFDGVTWNQFSSSTSVSFDPLSVQGIGSVLNPYYSVSDIYSLTSSESNIKDKMLFIDSTSKISNCKGISLEATINTDVTSYEYDNVSLSYNELTTGNTLYYNPESDITIECVTFLDNVNISLGVTLSGGTIDFTAGGANNNDSFLICKNNFGNILWIIRVNGRSVSLRDLYFDNSNGLIWTVCNYFGTADVFDYTDLYTSLFTLTYSGIANTRSNSVLLCFDFGGIYNGSTTTPYDISSTFSSTFASITGDRKGYIYVGGGLEAGATYTFNRYNNPAGTSYNVSPIGTAASNTGQPFIAKFNISTRLYEWTSYTNNSILNSSISYIHKLFIPNTSSFAYDTIGTLLIGSGFYISNAKSAGDFTNFGNVAYQNGTTVNVPIYYAPQTSDGLSKINVGIDTITGFPLWMNCSPDNSTSVMPIINTNSAKAAILDEQNYLTSGYFYDQTSVDQIYLVKQQWISVSITNASNVITSAALFTPGMNGMAIFGYGIPSGTRFNYTNASNGTLTNNATFTYGTGGTNNPAKVLITNQVNIVEITTTIGLTAVTSAGQFTASMNGQPIIGPNVNDATIFTFVDATNGTLSVNATATGTANHYIGNTSYIFNTIANGSGIYAYKIDYSGNYMWAGQICSSTINFNLDASINMKINRFNNLYIGLYTGSTVATFTFTNGDAYTANNTAIAKFDVKGNIIYSKGYTSTIGSIEIVAQVSPTKYIVYFPFATTITIDGSTFTGPGTSNLLRLFMSENSTKTIGMGLENLGLVATKFASNGIISTTAGLDIGTTYYINQSDGSITNQNIYGLDSAGIAINTNSLLLNNTYQ